MVKQLIDFIFLPFDLLNEILVEFILYFAEDSGYVIIPLFIGLTFWRLHG